MKTALLLPNELVYSILAEYTGKRIFETYDMEETPTAELMEEFYAVGSVSDQFRAIMEDLLHVAFDLKEGELRTAKSAVDTLWRLRKSIPVNLEHPGEEESSGNPTVLTSLYSGYYTGKTLSSNGNVQLSKALFYSALITSIDISPRPLVQPLIDVIIDELRTNKMARVVEDTANKIFDLALKCENRASTNHDGYAEVIEALIGYLRMLENCEADATAAVCGKWITCPPFRGVYQADDSYMRLKMLLRTFFPPEVMEHESVAAIHSRLLVKWGQAA